MSEKKHTPLPWTNNEHSVYVHSKDGNVCVCGAPRASTVVGYTKAEIEELDEPVANARLIVRAVNSHHILLEAARRMLDMLTLEGEPNALAIPSEIVAGDQVNEFTQAFADLEAAVAKASGA